MTIIVSRPQYDLPAQRVYNIIMTDRAFYRRRWLFLRKLEILDDPTDPSRLGVKFVINIHHSTHVPICPILRRYNTFFIRRREYRSRADVLCTLQPACLGICRFSSTSVLLNYHIFHGLTSATVILL